MKWQPEPFTNQDMDLVYDDFVWDVDRIHTYDEQFRTSWYE